MAKQNYNQMSNKPKPEKNKKVEKTSIETLVQETKVNGPEKTVPKKNPIGYVSNCEMLNIRSKPSTTSKILTVIDKETKIEIHEDLSTNEFYSVKVNCPQEVTVIGYAMKEYIKVES